VRQPQIAIASKSTVRAGLLSDHEQTGSYLIPHRFRIGDSKVDGDKRVYGESTHRLSLAKSRLRAIYGRRPFTTCAISSVFSGGSASARESLRRRLGSRWFTERFHRNALVTHFQHGQVFRAARRLDNYSVARCRLHQRAPQR
jgi:hypothetical protein